MLIRRVVFGEPKPGGVKFAAAISSIKDSASYCNRVGVLQHDRVTDVPFTVPELGLSFIHPTQLRFVSAAPPAGDAFGMFALHHMALYHQGAVLAALDPIHIEAARLCQAIYGYPGDEPEKWDACQETSGVFWALRFQGTRVYVVFRGSLLLLDWLRDLTALDPKIIAAQIITHEKFGLMWNGFLIGVPETWAVIKPLIAGFEEAVFCGHSLGAARATDMCAYAVGA